MERRIEDGLQRSGDAEQILLMEVGGDLDHAEPHRCQLFLDPCAIDMLADGADIDAGSRGDDCQGITGLRRLQPLCLFGGTSFFPITAPGPAAPQGPTHSS